MKTIKLSEKISIESAAYATQGNAILGLRGSGKSYSATYLAEQLMGEKIPFTAFDPIGVWRNLKLPGKGHGFPVVVVGDDADLPLNQKAIPDIIRATMREGINLVIDLYSLNLSKADWRSIVENSVSIMLHENKSHGLRHIFVEEAAEFAPQMVRPDQAKVYSVFEKLARMGGNASLGYTLINQRAEAVNKELLENCDMVFLHKQRGRNSVANLGKWLKSVSPETANAVLESLPNLKSGECWILPADSAIPQFVKMPQKQSFHPDRQNPTAARPSGKTVDVTVFVEKLKSALPKPEEKKPQTSKAAPIQREIIKEIEKIVEVPIFTDKDRELLTSVIKETRDIKAQIVGFESNLAEISMRVETQLQRLRILSTRRPAPLQSAITKLATSTPRIPSAAESPHIRLSSDDERASLLSGKSGVRRMLVALAQRSPLNRKQLGLRAKVSPKGGSFDTYISKAVMNGWISRDGSGFNITQEGLADLGPFEPLPSGQELIEHYLSQLGESGPARMLRALVDSYPRSMSRQELGETSQVSPAGGSFDTYVSKLVTLELITKHSGYKASDELFE